MIASYTDIIVSQRYLRYKKYKVTTIFNKTRDEYYAGRIFYRVRNLNKQLANLPVLPSKKKWCSDTCYTMVDAISHYPNPIYIINRKYYKIYITYGFNVGIVILCYR